MSDDLGDRMKGYEARETERRFLPYLPVYARIDGRCFSNFTRSMERPFDANMHAVMTVTTEFLVRETNACIGYTQSDEINLIWLVTKPKEQMLFDGKTQKLVSVLASMAAVRFFMAAFAHWPHLCVSMQPTFDCRVFQLPTLEEGANAILWREIDATKNAVSVAARHYYSHKQLHGQGSADMQEMLFQKGINFNDYPAWFKRGTFVQRKRVMAHLTDEELARIPEAHRPTEPVERWIVRTLDMPSFRKVTNRAAVIFEGADTLTATESGA